MILNSDTIVSISIAIPVSIYCKSSGVAQTIENNVIAYQEVVDALPQRLYTCRYFSFSIVCTENADECRLSLDFVESNIYSVNRAVISIRNDRKTQGSSNSKLTQIIYLCALGGRADTDQDS